MGSVTTVGTFLDNLGKAGLRREDVAVFVGQRLFFGPGLRGDDIAELIRQRLGFLRCQAGGTQDKRQGKAAAHHGAGCVAVVESPAT